MNTPENSPQDCGECRGQYDGECGVSCVNPDVPEPNPLHEQYSRPTVGGEPLSADDRDLFARLKSLYACDSCGACKDCPGAWDQYNIGCSPIDCLMAK